ncbi:HlyU family transcriptional regulator [Mesorhizobium xinjiangense]|uniref:HlyU family transcriptional regulator n=1 Tax=Mesorhizobium xinjiangense TaxID=2678685 RepID=UPI0012EEB3A4|nr:HlyU family transcriptional regulator [Mesorhizobium xinjiangense]
MSILKKLFGGGGEREEESGGEEIEHNGFRIRATPFKEGGQFQTCAVVTKEIGGALMEHRLIRADRFPDQEDAVAASLRKAKQMVDEQGDRMFG